MRRPDTYFNSLAGVPVYYDRFSDAPYGSIGKPYKFYADELFIKQLNACFDELWEICPLGKAVIINSAGTYVDKPGSYHNKGRAFDIDSIFWKDKSFVFSNFPKQPIFYLGVEAVLKKHFGTVLSFLYNTAHNDHIHIDNGSSKYFRKVKSTVLFIQATIVYVFEISIAIDGIWGPETESALSYVLNMLGLSTDINNLHVWNIFLTLSAKTAFDKETSSEKNPLDLLQDLYHVIGTELNNLPVRKSIECTLNTFVNHHETQDWLNTYRCKNIAKQS